ncbi:flagellar hook-associated protein FlgK [Blastococcus sp. SYSU DS0541]
MSTFSGLNTATTALWAHRRGLDVTGQNIANVNTEGYSRQRVDLTAVSGSTVPAFFSTSSGIGQGVSADEVMRIRDSFLEGRGHTEHANNAQLVAETDALQLVEHAFREPGDTGIQKMLAEMWSGWQDVANKPDDDAARGQVLKRLETVVGGLHFSQQQLGGQWDQTRENLAVLVDDVNAAAGNVAELNVAIQRATQSGLPSNDLADQRDLLIMKLADQVGATVRHGKDGVLDVAVGGMSLVSGGSATPIVLTGALDPEAAGTDPLRLATAAGDFTVRAGGTAAGQLAALNTIIPGYRAQLDGVAANLATALNDAHTAGFDLYGAAGTAILGSSGGGPVTATSIQVVITDPKRLAASSVGPGAPNLDHGNADAIAQLATSVTGVDAGYRKMIVELGVQSAVSQRNLAIQGSITTTVDAARDSVAGVNLDEELTNMLSYQHAYSAAGRMITAIDEALDVLINRTGLVGR